MPWDETSTMDQERLFIQDYVRGSFAMAELCRRYGISRPTGYKWIERFESEGPPGLEERSRRPEGCSHETAIEITEPGGPDVTIRHFKTLAAGFAAVRATDNTRKALWDVMKRTEVYATTGTRITVRGFAGLDFSKGEVCHHVCNSIVYNSTDLKVGNIAHAVDS